MQLLLQKEVEVTHRSPETGRRGLDKQIKDMNSSKTGEGKVVCVCARECVCARVCACEVHKCSTCHSSFRGSYLGEQGHLAEPALLRGRRISVATRCRFDSRYPLACRDMTPCHCARRIKHSKQRASSSLASFLRRKKTFFLVFHFLR